MKTLNTILCGLGLLFTPALQAQDDWTLKSPATKPSARFIHGMASLGGDQVLLFGGYDGAEDDETWVYDLSDNIWTQKSPATKPSARQGPAMASLGGDQVLLFGGYDASGLDDETWVYDLSDNTWTLKSPATKPSARQGHAMASLGDDQVLLFGGSGGAFDDETWVYDLSEDNWTPKSPATQPSVRGLHAMASLGGDQVLLFGGLDFDVGGFDDETWVYDLSDNIWTQKSPATQPSGRYGPAMASLGGNQVLLFGGFDGAYDDETWVYDLSDDTWTLKSPATKPSARYTHAMASLGGDQVLLFGGAGAAVDDETWVYTATPFPDLTINDVTQNELNSSTSIFTFTVSLSAPAGAGGVTFDIATADGTAQDDNPATEDNDYVGRALTGQTIPAASSTYTFDVTINGDIGVEPNETFFVNVTNVTGATLDDGQGQGTITNDDFEVCSPVITTVAPMSLWPPNHKYQTITAAERVVSVSGCADLLVDDVVITQVTSDEPEDVLGGGDGNTVNDIVIDSGCKSVQLRRERQGSGNGRVYTIHLSVDAGDGNTGAATCLVTVPKSQNGNPAVDDGPAYTETGSYESVSKIIGFEEASTEATLPEGYALSQNYPNPFNPSTTIKFAMPEAGRVTLRIYSLTGQLVRELTPCTLFQRQPSTGLGCEG